MQDITTILRKLAKSDKYQNLLSVCKDIPTIKLFNNSSDLTPIQSIFLSYLYFYKDIYLDVYSNKINDIIFTDFIYEDAYSKWKRENSTKKIENKKKDIKLVFDKPHSKARKS